MQAVVRKEERERVAGLLGIGAALGIVLGALLGARVSRLFGAGPSLLLSVLINGIVTFAVGLQTNPFVVVGLCAVAGFWIGVWNVITVSLRQWIVPDGLLGRVNRSTACSLGA